MYHLINILEDIYTRVSSMGNLSKKGLYFRNNIFNKHICMIIVFIITGTSIIPTSMNVNAAGTEPDNDIVIQDEIIPLIATPTLVNLSIDKDLDNILKDSDSPNISNTVTKPERVYESEEQDRDPVKVETLIIEIEEDNKFIYSEQIPLSRELQQYTYNKCLEKGVEYELVLALMWRESRFQVNAQGYNSWNGTHDNGIMQINDCNKGWLYRDHGIDNLYDPYQCIDAGLIILGDLTEKYGDHDALMAYQYGEAGMKKKFSQGIYTNNSIQNLFMKRDEFKEIIAQV